MTAETTTALPDDNVPTRVTTPPHIAEPGSEREAALAALLYDQAQKLENYHDLVLGDTAPFTDRTDLRRTHFDAKYGEGWYDENAHLIDLGERNTLDKARAKAQAEAEATGPDPRYAAVADTLPPRPGLHDTLALQAWMKHAQGQYAKTLRDWDRVGVAAEAPDHLLRLDDGDISPALDIVAPYFRDDEVTTFFGDGGSGKSTVAAAVTVTIGTDRGLQAFNRTGDKRPVIVLPYESRKGLQRRLRGLAGDADTGLIKLMPRELMLGAIWDDADKMAELIRSDYSDHGGPVGTLLVDSVAFAIGGLSAIDAEAATGFSRAVETIGLPALVIAHQTKAADASKPFGSVFWHNLNRMTWHVQRDESTGRMTFTCRKDNEGEMLGHRRYLETVYDEAGIPTDMQATDGMQDNLAGSILALLATAGDLNAKEIADALGSAPDTVRTTIRRHGDLFSTNNERRPARYSARVKPR